MRARLIAVAALALALPACAVLTIDVDVYKGALANHESVQTEQVAAMAMGAKPLLAELRYQLERNACPRPGDVDEDKKDRCPGADEAGRTANFVLPDMLRSRDAQRVNEILSLYEDVAATGVGQFLRALNESLGRLIARIEEGLQIAVPYIEGGKDNQKRRRAAALAEGALKARVGEPESREIATVRAAWDAVNDTWQEAIRILSSNEIRARLKELRSDVIWDVAWIAADLTSAEGLRRLLTDEGAPTALKAGPLARLGELLPVLTRPETDLLRRKEAQDSVLAVVAQMLADENVGPQLATQLAFAQGYAGALPARAWFIVAYPTPESLLDAASLLADLKAFLVNRQERLGIGLGAGRLEEGLETLIDQYLKANHAPPGPDWRRTVTEKRRKLLDALVNFAEKVVVIANFDTLVTGASPNYFEGVLTRTTRDRYVRLLQAVGNSILSQVDALRQSKAHRDGLTRARETEIKGLRNAEARAASVLKQIIGELRAKPASFPGKTEILPLLEAGQAKVGESLDKLGLTLQASREKLTQERATAARYATAHSVLISSTVAEVVAGFAATPSTTDDVVSAITRRLAELEARERLVDAPSTEAAQRWRTAADVISSTEFTDAAPDKGAPEEKHRARVLQVGRKREETEKTAMNTAAIAADLERWHSSLARFTRPSPSPLAIPERIREGRPYRGDEPTAKDVLDVLLATLRYQHVNEVAARGHESSLSSSLGAAVELIYAYRSGMLHIRPAATFLRNSYPATILQHDPSAGVWRNMLTQHAKRQLPFYDLFQGQKEEVKINNAIDKQFWQSVNQVRVAGVGRTNYAIAKDDVGNWYVKSYSSNPEDIIKSAKNLALFSAGPALGANFLGRGGSAQRSGLEALEAARQTATGASTPEPTGTTTAPASKEARSTLAKQFERVSKRYEEQTLAARKSLKEEIEGLNGKLKKTVSDRVSAGDAKKLDDANVFTPPGGKAIEDLGQDKRADGTSKPVSTLSAEIAAALRAVKRHRNDVLARIATMTVAKGETPGAGQLSAQSGLQARQAVDAVFRDLLERQVKERQGSTTQYESMLLLIGESAGL